MCIYLFCRDEQRARELFRQNPNLEFCNGDLNNYNDIKAAFDSPKKKLTHVVFMAGGDDIDYKAVNYHAVAAFAE